jgi:hypothetical protein
MPTQKTILPRVKRRLRLTATDDNDDVATIPGGCPHCGETLYVKPFAVYGLCQFCGPVNLALLDSFH